MAEKINSTSQFISLDRTELLAKVRNLKEEGYRFVQLCGIPQKEGDAYLMYSFDKDYVLENYKVFVKDGEEVESITGSYWNAFVYENEIHDLFGITILHNALDFGGNFFKTADSTPWKTK